jgi:hypothetical protein
MEGLPSGWRVYSPHGEPDYSIPAINPVIPEWIYRASNVRYISVEERG